MREIKFRAWDTRINKMVFADSSREYLDECGELTNEQSKDSWRTYGDYEEDEYYPLRQCHFWFPSYNKEVVLMQYTGLKDKNGVEVYESDLVLIDGNRVCKIEWHAPTGQWDSKFVSEKEPTPKWTFMGMHELKERSEIIGNIYENPELLK